MSAEEIRVTKYTPFNKEGNLKGFFNIVIPKWGNFYINNMKHFKKNEHDWIAFPSKEYEDVDGKTSYFPYNGFEKNEMKMFFEKKVLTALEVYNSSPKT